MKQKEMMKLSGIIGQQMQKTIQEEVPRIVEKSIKESEKRMTGKIQESENKIKRELRGEIKESKERMISKINESEENIMTATSAGFNENTEDHIKLNKRIDKLINKKQNNKNSDKKRFSLNGIKQLFGFQD